MKQDPEIAPLETGLRLSFLLFVNHIFHFFGLFCKIIPSRPEVFLCVYPRVD